MTTGAIKFRATLAGLLFTAPILALVGIGAYHLYATKWTILYIPLTAISALGYVAGTRLVQRVREPLAAAGPPPPDYWTARDQAAWKIVEAAAMGATAPTPDELGDLARYARQAQELAMRVARIYRPEAREPFGHLTLPEVLACCELVAHDLSEKFGKFVPGGHLLNISEIRRVQSLAMQASDWYPKLRTAYWLGAAVFNPVQVALQAALTTQAVGPANKKFQENIVLWFQTVYLKELGKHLIELNSGRLRVGAKRYRELMEQHRVPQPLGEDEVTTETPTTATVEELPVTVALVGPVKAGKSSLVNALLGEQRAATDVAPLTAGQVRYALRRPGMPPLTLIDTLGFGNAGPNEDDVRIAIDAAGTADVLLVVVPARSAARKPEVEFLARVRAGIAAKPELKLPPIVVALSHADLLTPAMEWNPPYDWRDGQRPKEVSMRDAVAAAREQFDAAAVVPVCCVPGREAGVRDELVAEIVSRLGEARGVGFLRAVAAEASADGARKLFHQVVAAGGKAAQVLWQTYRK